MAIVLPVVILSTIIALIGSIGPWYDAAIAEAAKFNLPLRAGAAAIPIIAAVTTLVLHRRRVALAILTLSLVALIGTTLYVRFNVIVPILDQEAGPLEVNGTAPGDLAIVQKRAKEIAGVEGWAMWISFFGLLGMAGSVLVLENLTSDLDRKIGVIRSYVKSKQ